VADLLGVLHSFVGNHSAYVQVTWGIVDQLQKVFTMLMIPGKIMLDKTITRADLHEAVYNKVGLSRTESARLTERVLTEILDAVERGENVKLSGFGSFVLRDKAERVGRNPKTGVEAIITPRRVMTFKASNLLKARVAGEAYTGKDD
jgi:integration host factor subunit alpha